MEWRRFVTYLSNDPRTRKVRFTHRQGCQLSAIPRKLLQNWLSELCQKH